jgi:hypothetical protein
MKVHGSCHCGAIRFEADADPGKAGVCHCTDCQSLTGSAFALFLQVPKEGFRLTAGEPKIYVKTAESGNRRAQAFCAHCGSRLWAAAEKGGRAEKVATYGICAASGVLGPKRYEGDYQVPEGYYVLSYGWAESNFHLEMKVSYPNLVDKVLGPKNRSLGGEIMIHGSCGSIGCMAMGDERAEELWVMMKAMGDAQVKVFIYPGRDMKGLLDAADDGT